MVINKETNRWMDERGARDIEFALAMTGNPRVGAFVDHDTLAVLVLMAKRSLAYQDYSFEVAEGMRKRVAAAQELTDVRAFEYIENAMADHYAHVQAWVAEEKESAVPAAQHG